MTLSKRFIISISSLCVALAACGDDDSTPADRGHEDGGISGRGGSGSHAGSGGSSASGSGGSTAADSGAPAGRIELAGMWTSMYGDETIDDTMWNGASLIRYDNAANEAITQDPPSEDDAGVAIDGAFNKLVWTEPASDAFYYCWVAFGQASAADADANAMPADDSDPDNGGCGDADFPWTKLERK